MGRNIVINTGSKNVGPTYNMYDKEEPLHLLNILGTVYRVYEALEEDPNVDGRTKGYIDYTNKSIIITTFNKTTSDFADIEVYNDDILRHEIIHAFLKESGLTSYYEDEILVEMLTVQVPKMCKLLTDIGNI